MQKQLSIITVNRNNDVGLERTIQSVLSQSYRDFEFIVIDGDSTDGSLEIIKKYKKSVTNWVSEPDKGTYQAMNKGIKRSTGFYCLFLNSGDFFIDNRVLERIFIQDIHADIVSGNVLKVRPNKKYRRVSSHETVSLHKLCIHSLPHQSTLIKRLIFDEIGFYNEHYRIVSDWEFFLKALIIYEKSYQHIEVDISFFKIDGISSKSENFPLAKKESIDCLIKNFPKLSDDLIELRYFYNSNFGQIVNLIKKNKNLYSFFESVCGFLLKVKKTIIGK